MAVMTSWQNYSKVALTSPLSFLDYCLENTASRLEKKPRNEFTCWSIAPLQCGYSIQLKTISIFIFIKRCIIHNAQLSIELLTKHDRGKLDMRLLSVYGQSIPGIITLVFDNHSLTVGWLYLTCSHEINLINTLKVYLCYGWQFVFFVSLRTPRVVNINM